jgi:secondary thiamine-phosphate synthase enzyme
MEWQRPRMATPALPAQPGDEPMERFEVRTGKQTEFVDITAQLADVVQRSGVQSGSCTVFVPHTTAACTINEHADPDVARDMLAEINKLVPFEDNYRHSEGNSAAHIKTSLFGSSHSIPIEGGRLQLGTWQGVFLCEFDGPRTRQVWVQVLGQGVH